MIGNLTVAQTTDELEKLLTGPDDEVPATMQRFILGAGRVAALMVLAATLADYLDVLTEKERNEWFDRAPVLADGLVTILRLYTDSASEQEVFDLIKGLNPVECGMALAYVVEVLRALPPLNFASLRSDLTGEEPASA